MVPDQSDSNENQPPEDDDPASSLLDALEAAKKKRDAKNQILHPVSFTDTQTTPLVKIKIFLFILGILPILGLILFLSKGGEKTLRPSPTPVAPAPTIQPPVQSSAPTLKPSLILPIQGPPPKPTFIPDRLPQKPEDDPRPDEQEPSAESLEERNRDSNEPQNSVEDPSNPDR